MRIMAANVAFWLGFLAVGHLWPMEEKSLKKSMSYGDFIEVGHELPTPIDWSLFEKVRSDQKSQEFGGGILYAYDPNYLPEVFKGYFTEETYIRTLHVYVPDELKEVKDPDVGIYIVVHGTGADKNPWYYDDSDTVYQGILNYAARKADVNKTVMYIYSYRWCGSLNSVARMDAGVRLATILNGLLWAKDNKPSRIKYCDGLAHSYGCAVIFIAANYLVKREFEEIIAMAPVVSEEHHWLAIHQAKNVFPIVSELDFVVPTAQFLFSDTKGNSCDKWVNFCKRSPKLHESELYGEDKEKQEDDEESDTTSNYKKPSCYGRVTHLWFFDKNIPSSHSQTAYKFIDVMHEVMKLVYKQFTYKNDIHNIALNVLPKDVMENRYNISLYPRDEEEKLHYQKELKDTGILELSEENDKKHFEIYKYNKGEMSLAYKCLKGLWKLRHDI